MKKIVFPICFLLAIITCVCYAQNNAPATYTLLHADKALPAKGLSMPQIMIRLCAFSYITDKTEKKRIVADSIHKELPGWELAWGPFELTDIFGITYSSMYIAKTDSTCAVVIRGTDPTSLKSWFGEDFEIHKSVSFKKFVPSAPSAAKISKGTCNGLDDLLKLKDPDNGSNVVSFLQNELTGNKIKYLYVTGHSLGGTLTPAFYTYLCYKLFHGPAPYGITAGPYSFAGLTAGNRAFNDFIAAYLKSSVDKQWRYVNPLDLAPRLWESDSLNLNSIKNIYLADSLKFGSPESEFVDYLIDRAKPNNYMQPPGSELKLPAVFNPCETVWIFQALSQHHFTTYIKLVDSVSISKK